MARKRKPHERKLRTREHIIADLSVNYVERQILLRGYSVDEPTRDYGIDLSMSAYNASGEIEAGSVLFQIKATDSLTSQRRTDGFVNYWHRRSQKLARTLGPVILAIYDAKKDRGLVSLDRLLL